MREKLRWTDEISKVVISKSNGKWFASISVHLDDGNYKHQLDLFDAKQPIGIDVGINTLATCSDGTTYDNPRPLKRYERKLARANRRLSRRQKGSQNWYKAKDMLTRVHARIRHIREDAHHQASIRIIRKASAIGIETLNISGLLKNRKLAKALSDAALSRFLTMLRYKADRRGIPITEADQFFASSPTCSNCGHKKTDLTLSERTCHCTECDFECNETSTLLSISAPLNHNTVATSCEETINAYGVSVRPHLRGTKQRSRKSGTNQKKSVEFYRSL